jgi:hypothetical protein
MYLLLGLSNHPTNKHLFFSSRNSRFADLDERAKIVDAICSRGFELRREERLFLA